MECGWSSIQNPRPTIVPVTTGNKITATIVIAEHISGEVSMYEIIGVEKHHVDAVPVAGRPEPGADEPAFANLVGKPFRQIALGCERDLQDDDVSAGLIAEIWFIMTGDDDKSAGVSAAPNRSNGMA